MSNQGARASVNTGENTMSKIQGDLEWLARDIEHATPRELENAAQFFANQANGQSFSPARRLIYKAFGNFLKLYIRKHGRVSHVR